MNYGKLILTMLTVGYFAFPALARNLESSTLVGHPHLKTTAQSLQLARGDWPEVEDQVIRHCLQNLKDSDQKKPGRGLDQRLDAFDKCCARWTTLGALKNQYTD